MLGDPAQEKAENKVYVSGRASHLEKMDDVHSLTLMEQAVSSETSPSIFPPAFAQRQPHSGLQPCLLNYIMFLNDLAPKRNVYPQGIYRMA